ncbi:MAG: hypothetical protein HRU46_01505 [Verrucomicrobiales bacterium]|nr:hypothetical protein [Verrucomicrobiales bacterium]
MFRLFNHGSNRRGPVGVIGALITFTLSTMSLVGQQATRLASEFDRRLGPPSTFQKPIAWEVADHTLLLQGAILGGGSYLFDAVDTQGLIPGNEGWEAFYAGITDLRVTRRMPNSVAYGIDGRVIFDGASSSNFNFNDTRFDIYLRGRWGQISYGDFDDRNLLLISGRTGLAGEATLFYDGFFSPPGGRAFRYRARYSSFLVDAAIDEDGNTYNVSLLYRSPTRTRKDSWSLDYHGGDFMNRYERNGITAAYDIAYGSWNFKVAGAWDRFNPYANFARFDRIAGSVCVSYKFEALTTAAGVMLSQTNGSHLETTYTAGFRYDLARGLALNGGYFYIDSDSLGTDGLPVAAGNFSGMRTSISYRF